MRPKPKRIVTKEQRRKWQSNWRQRHPVLALWHNHKHNAKNRGIKVEWSFDDFARFCEETGYHILVRDGWTIDRIRSREGYSYENCQLLTLTENVAKGNRERKSIYHLATEWKAYQFKREFLPEYLARYIQGQQPKPRAQKHG